MGREGKWEEKKTKNVDRKEIGNKREGRVGGKGTGKKCR